MHCSQHAGYKLVNAIAFLHQRHQRSNSALIVCAAAEMRKDELLKGIDLVLKRHEIGNGFIAVTISVWCLAEEQRALCLLTLHLDH